MKKPQLQLLIEATFKYLKEQPGMGPDKEGPRSIDKLIDKDKYSDYAQSFDFGDPISFYGCLDPEMFVGDGEDSEGVGAEGDLPTTVDGLLDPYGGITDGFCGGPYYLGYGDDCTQDEIENFECTGGPLLGDNFVTNESFETIEGGFIGNNTYPSAYELGILCDTPTPTLQNYADWLNAIIGINQNGLSPTTNTTQGFNAGKFTFLPGWTNQLVGIIEDVSFEWYYTEADAEYNCCEDEDLGEDGFCYQHGCPYLDETVEVDNGNTILTFVPGDGYTGSPPYSEWPITGFGATEGSLEGQELISLGVCPPADEIILGCMVEGADNYLMNNQGTYNPEPNTENGSCTFDDYVIELDVCGEQSAVNYYCESNNGFDIIQAWYDADNMPQYDFGNGLEDIFPFNGEDFMCDQNDLPPTNISFNFSECNFIGCTDENAPTYGFIVYDGELTDPTDIGNFPIADFNIATQINPGGPCGYVGCPNHVNDVGQNHPAMDLIPNIANDDDNDTVVNYNYVGNQNNYNINMADLGLPAIGTADDSGQFTATFGDGCPDANGDPDPLDQSCCVYEGCMTNGADNYIGGLGDDLGIYILDENVTCEYVGCMDPSGENYDAGYNVPCGLPNDIDNCCGDILGCTDSDADNFNPNATEDDGSCEYGGCMDPDAINYDPNANVDDGSCEYTDKETCFDITIIQCGAGFLQTAQLVCEGNDFRCPSTEEAMGEQFVVECVSLGQGLEEFNAENIFYPGYTVSLTGCPDMGDPGGTGDNFPVQGYVCVDNIPNAAYNVNYDIINTYGNHSSGTPEGCCVGATMPNQYSGDPDFYAISGDNARPYFPYMTYAPNLAGYNNALAWCLGTSPCANNMRPGQDYYCNGDYYYQGQGIGGIDEDIDKYKNINKSKLKERLLNEIPTGDTYTDVFDEYGDVYDCTDVEWTQLNPAVYNVVSISQGYETSYDQVTFLEEATATDCSDQFAAIDATFTLDADGNPVTDWSMQVFDTGKTRTPFTGNKKQLKRRTFENRGLKEANNLIKKSKKLRESIKKLKK